MSLTKVKPSRTSDIRTTNAQSIALELSDNGGDIDEDISEDNMGVADAREHRRSRVR